MYLASPPEIDDSALHAREPEALVVEETAKAMAVTPLVVEQRLRAGTHDAVTICYFLVLDHRKKFATDPMIIEGERRSRANSSADQSDVFPECVVFIVFVFVIVVIDVVVFVIVL